MPTADPLDAGQLADAPDRFPVERQRLLRRPLVVDRHVQRQDVARVDAGLAPLQRDQRREQRAGAGQQHERRGDLRDREQPQAPVRAGRDPDAAVRQAEAVRRLGGGQPRHERQQHRRHQRQADADPQQAGIDREVERAHREARRVARQDRHHRPAISTPSAAPAPHSSRLSASSVRRSAPVLAPSAARIASSPSRRTERARIRLATFEHAMTKISPDAASSTSRMVRAGEVI